MTSNLGWPWTVLVQAFYCLDADAKSAYLSVSLVHWSPNASDLMLDDQKAGHLCIMSILRATGDVHARRPWETARHWKKQSKTHWRSSGCRKACVFIGSAWATSKPPTQTIRWGCKLYQGAHTSISDRSLIICAKMVTGDTSQHCWHWERCMMSMWHFAVVRTLTL